MYDLKGSKKLQSSLDQGQVNFRGHGGFEANAKIQDLDPSKPRPRTSNTVLVAATSDSYYRWN